MRYNTDYSYRLHTRLVEEDLELATVMYSTHGIEGPWHDMATCHPDWVDDIVGALIWREDERRAEREVQNVRLRAEIEGYDQFENPMEPPNKFDITLESQGSAKLTSNLWELVEKLRFVNVYSPGQITELVFEAAELMQARRG